MPETLEQIRFADMQPSLLVLAMLVALVALILGLALLLKIRDLKKMVSDLKYRVADAERLAKSASSGASRASANAVIPALIQPTSAKASTVAEPVQAAPRPEPPVIVPVRPRSLVDLLEAEEVVQEVALEAGRFGLRFGAVRSPADPEQGANFGDAEGRIILFQDPASMDEFAAGVPRGRRFDLEFKYFFESEGLAARSPVRTARPARVRIHANGGLNVVEKGQLVQSG